MIAPCLDAVGLDFQIQPVAIFQLAGPVLGLDIVALGVIQHGRGAEFESYPVFSYPILTPYPVLHPVHTQLTTESNS